VHVPQSTKMAGGVSPMSKRGPTTVRMSSIERFSLRPAYVGDTSDGALCILILARGY
jgi:hypothetical protein